MSLTTVVSDLDIEGLPDTLELWSCVGCGAMGTFSVCTGACKFAKTEIVAAESYAELLELSLFMREPEQKLGVVFRRLARVVEGGRSDFETLHREIQTEARDALATLSETSRAISTVVLADVASSEVWLCKTCGQVDAPQQCLGICVRRNADHVRMEAFQSLAKQAILQRRALDEGAALLRRICAVTPKEGQWKGAVLAFQTEARRLSQYAHSSDDKLPETISPGSVSS